LLAARLNLLRVAADGRPDRAQRLQASLRGRDAEATRCSRSKSNGFPARPGYPPTGPSLKPYRSPPPTHCTFFDSRGPPF